ncbi:MAG: serine/threonine-protein kinase [Candidatus Thiodiazotropha sp.]
MSACDLLESLYERPKLRVDRGRRKDGTAVVLKRLTGDATPRARSRFRHEYELLNKIDLPGVVGAFELEEKNDDLVMVLQDIGGESLEQLLASNGKLSLEQFLELATGLAETLAGLYRLRIVHKAINPAHIIFNTDSGEFRLVGFGDAEELAHSGLTLKPAMNSEENLAYISPEQTGRMNRPIDYRTDFYSLGVTSYRILTGKLPFEADDAMGMIHSHIAKAPIPPSELDPNIPRVVSDIVMKLMAKIADDRYQSGWGLKSDLDKCLGDFRKEGAIHPFELGREDFSDQLRIPQKLYGRQKEIDRILQLFERASAGESGLLLVAGYPGIGKTTLVPTHC